MKVKTTRIFDDSRDEVEHMMAPFWVVRRLSSLIKELSRHD